MYTLQRGLSANVEEIKEASHHEHFFDVFVDVLDDDASTLGSDFLTDGEEETQTGRTDILQYIPCGCC